MAVLYQRTRTDLDDPHVEIRTINDDGYVIALGFHSDTDDDEDSVTEVLLTMDEVLSIYDAAFNK